MKPIATLTLNPTIDGASEADVVRPIHKVRTRKERFDPGGGGVNVSRVVRELGGDTLAVYLAGGATGPVLDALLERRAVPRRLVPIAGHTRISQTVFETSTGREFRFVPEGPKIAPEEAQNCLRTLAGVDCDWLVASGSLPRGLPAEYYVEVAAQARARGARIVVDTSGDALRSTIAAGGVHLCKPSQGEFEALVGRALSPKDLEREAADLVASGRVTLLAITLGHEGAVLADADGVFRLPALPVEAKSAVGAGDSFVGAMTLALARGQSPRDAFVLGLAAGAAAVLTPGSELCRRDDVERLHSEALRLVKQASGSA